MAFTGTAVKTQISDRCVRVTGLSLAAAASGLFGLFGSTVVGAEALPDGFNPKPYAYQGDTIPLTESVRVTWNFVGDAPATAVPLRIVKSGTGLAFQIEVTNEDGAAATPEIEFYIEFRD
ncbi:MAG: hypothetical protein IT338_17540 [Thermomicrobiales bacterium]|nr:hypothetical protein [Thermomicrobiales bacterium]